MTVETELEFREWLPKISERLRLILYDIKGKTDITEEDYEVLKFFHKIYWMGEMPFYKSKLNLPTETATEIGLFAGQIDSTAGKGIEVDYTQNKKEQLTSEIDG